MAGQSNEDVVRSFIEEGWNKGNTKVLEQVVAPNAVGHVSHEPTPRRDIKRVEQVIKSIHAASKDFKVTIDDIVSAGDRVAVRWTAHGTHTGALAGINATNKAITVTGSDFYHLKNGKIVEGWQNWDALALLTGLGAVKPPWPTTAHQ